MSDDRRRWDERHERAPMAVPAPPEGLAASGVVLPARGTALDVACGRGGVAVWAASTGLTVTALDISPVAVAATRALALRHDVAGRVEASVHDLTAGLPDGTGRFDLVMCQRYRQPELWPALVDHTVAGGIVVVTVLSTAGRPAPGRHRAEPGALAAEFGRLSVEIVHHREAAGAATIVARRV